MNINITPVAAYKDNYIWILHNDQHAVVVDPGLAEPVADYLSANNLTLTHILITHHHWDHVNGLVALQEQFNCPVFAPLDSRIPGTHSVVKESQIIELPELDLTFQIMEIPGHTLSHICYFNDQYLFCGDTLFSIGCGRMFEGNPEQYVNSLNKIKALPAETMVYCAHEYTLNNIEFALSIEPDNKALKTKQQEVYKLRLQNLPSLPVKLGSEMTLNPFLKTYQKAMQAQLENKLNININDEVTCFARLRSYKDGF